MNTNKVAVITGSSERLGRELAYLLSKGGYHIVVHYVSDDIEAQKTVKSITNRGGEAISVKADLSKSQDVQHLVDATLKAWGRWDVLINNASVFHSTGFEDVDDQKWDYDYAIHAKAPFFLTQALYTHRKEHSYKESGVVINITDTQVQRPTISRPSYYLSKADLSYQVFLLAKTCAPYVRVNGVAPGPIIPMSEKDLPYFNKREELNPLHHLAKVEDVVQAVDFLICNQSITGVVIPVDAGEHLL